MTNPTIPMPHFGRRAMLQGLVGAAALGGLTACGGDKKSSTAPGSGASVGGTVTVGSSQSDDIPKKAFAQMMAGFKKADVKINTIQHETFKEGINNYLQGSPDDVFTWFAGYRARYFADKGLVGDITDVWEKIDGMPESMKKLATANDKQVFVPSTYYPWGIFYRPSVWKQHGYEVPKTKDEWLTLCEKMKKDGLTPIAFANKDGWEAMGTFDMLNLRINGYDHHVKLMAGEESWESEQVKKVFAAWKELLPFHQADSLGRTWQEAAQSLVQKKSGMYTMGMFISQQFQASKDAKDDLDFFPFPEFDAGIGAKVVEAPVDGFMMAAKPKNEAAAKELLLYLSTPEAVGITIKSDPSVIGANSKADQASYTALQKKAVTMIEEAENISQFLDRDSRPDFANTVVGPAFQQFTKDPSQIDSILKSVEEQKKSIFA
ncbi:MULTISPECIES: ABC transporter substrate-binding protein [unclassified Luteococcus]|uniref:ABC transporter substrate-binding protein n=1 Tax=unclassified Luteococcus TaxID=2639923 RepID=UPI00313C25BF